MQNQICFQQVSKNVEHACENIDFYTKDMSGAAFGTGNKVAETD
jgi:hypothetical protein